MSRVQHASGKTYETETPTSSAKLTFLNHASFQVETQNSILVIDPWLEGTAFNDGWALIDRTTSNERLICELKAAQKSLYVWYSHEHSDHFAIPFLKQLKNAGLNPIFIFQKTLDGRVSAFLRKNGFTVIEPSSGEEVRIDPELSISTWPHDNLDHYSFIKVAQWSILNLNDCVIRTLEDARAVLNGLDRKIDFLFSQFGYANWIGNEADVEMREEDAHEKLVRMALQDQVLQPTYLIPFASFIYFCHRENFYMNDRQNTPKVIRSSPTLAHIQEKIVFLKPYDAVELGDKDRLPQALSEVTASAERHWEDLFSKQVQPEQKLKSIAVAEIQGAFLAYRRTCAFNFLLLPQVLEVFGRMAALDIFLTDAQIVVRLSYLKGMRILPSSAAWDISMSSPALLFVLKHEYGFDTLQVNGRFRTAQNISIGKAQKFFSPQDFMKRGFGVRHPYSSAKQFLPLLPSIFLKILKQASRSKKLHAG